MNKNEIEKKILELNQERSLILDKIEHTVMTCVSFNDINMTRFFKEIIHIRSQLTVYLDIYATL
jgi:hypothetical protein